MPPTSVRCWTARRYKLREHGIMLSTCITGVLSALHSAHPKMGATIAIDGSDLPAYANGQRYVKRGGELPKRFADPDASWGHRSSISTRSGGGYYRYKVHAAVDTATGLPVAWQVQTAKDSEVPVVPVLLDSAMERGFAAQVAVLDRGYDTEALYALLESRDIRPVIPLRQTPAVKAGKHNPPRASMASGRSPGPTPSGGPPSGGAPRVSASPRRRG